MCTEAEGLLSDSTCPEDTYPLPAKVVDGSRYCCLNGPITLEQCAALDGVSRVDPGDGSLDGCAQGERILAGFRDLIEGGYCCGIEN